MSIAPLSGPASAAVPGRMPQCRARRMRRSDRRSVRLKGRDVNGIVKMFSGCETEDSRLGLHVFALFLLRVPTTGFRLFDSKLSPNVWIICYIKYRFHFTVLDNIGYPVYRNDLVGRIVG